MFIIYVTFISYLKVIHQYLCAGQLGQSTAEYVINVLLDLITIVDGWYLHLLLDGIVFCFIFVLNLSLLIQNNCIGEKNTRYFVAFLVW